MLPRNGGTRKRDMRPGGGMDIRKLILGVMLFLFISYFVVVNMFFSLNRSGLRDHTVAEANVAAAANAVATEDTPAPPAAPETTTAPEQKWKRNPDRKYVWIDVAIDDVPIGRITAELYTDVVPKTAENFRALTTGEKGGDLTYKNSVCHRIIKGFVVQCGDFETGKGYGGRSIYGAKFDDEPNGLRLKHSKRYILQMANSGPNTNGSQFCFMLGPQPHLNGHHVVFGEVVDGFEVVDQMEAAGATDDGVPMEHKVSLIGGGEVL